MTVLRDSTGATARTCVAPDPRRPGKALALVKCWCGRAYTLTGEELRRNVAGLTNPCPNPECGKGEQ